MTVTKNGSVWTLTSEHRRHGGNFQTALKTFQPRPPSSDVSRTEAVNVVLDGHLGQFQPGSHDDPRRGSRHAGRLKALRTARSRSVLAGSDTGLLVDRQLGDNPTNPARALIRMRSRRPRPNRSSSAKGNGDYVESGAGDTIYLGDSGLNVHPVTGARRP